MLQYAVDCVLQVVIAVYIVLYFSVSLCHCTALSIYSTEMLYAVACTYVCVVGIGLPF